MRKNNQLFIVGALFVSALLNWVPFSSAKDLIGVDKALRKIFRNATHFDLEHLVLSDEQVMIIEKKARINFKGAHSTKIQMYLAKEEDQMLGFAFEDIVIGKWGPIHYLVGLDPQGTVLDVIVLDYQEIRGRPIAKRRFLRQYKHKTVKNPLLLRKDINGVTGATISSRSLTNGVRKLLHVFDTLKLYKYTAREIVEK